MKVTETAVQCSGRSGSGLEKVVERRQKVKVTAEKEKKDRMWKELLEQNRRERRERKGWKQMEKHLEEEMNECEKQSEQCRKVWKMSVAAEEDGWTSVKGRREKE